MQLLFFVVAIFLSQVPNVYAQGEVRYTEDGLQPVYVPVHDPKGGIPFDISDMDEKQIKLLKTYTGPWLYYERLWEIEAEKLEEEINNAEIKYSAPPPDDFEIIDFTENYAENGWTMNVTGKINENGVFICDFEQTVSYLAKKPLEFKCGIHKVVLTITQFENPISYHYVFDFMDGILYTETHILDMDCEIIPEIFSKTKEK